MRGVENTLKTGFDIHIAEASLELWPNRNLKAKFYARTKSMARGAFDQQASALLPHQLLLACLHLILWHENPAHVFEEKCWHLIHSCCFLLSKEGSLLVAGLYDGSVATYRYTASMMGKLLENSLKGTGRETILYMP